MRPRMMNALGPMKTAPLTQFTDIHSARARTTPRNRPLTLITLKREAGEPGYVYNGTGSSNRQLDAEWRRDTRLDERGLPVSRTGRRAQYAL